MTELNVVLAKSKRKLCTIKVSQQSTIADIKKEIAKQRPALYIDRQSIRIQDPGKNQPDKATVHELSLKNGSEIYLKDLGPQISWKLVFILEYLGPLVVYFIIAQRPWLVYGNTYKTINDYSFVYHVALLCWSLHYLKRLLETLFVHRFSHSTMPLFNLFKNCGYYWGFAAYVAYYVNHPLYTSPNMLLFIFGLALFTICEIGNLSIHLLLRDLRPPGTKEKKIPKPNKNPLTKLFNFVSCPNYTYEFGAWLGFSLMTSCLPAFLFTLAGMYQMTVWALGKHKAYKKDFPRYPKERKAILPFVI
ncbi:very-long-chain enoyl-CoA reductase [Agrilus planipennis]|uniref:very-long-chain enoyl-CoA reductase n=1 Tax=Agrilus planipennis TaxID=224129 RepID=A0A1W4X4D0_AGRPL|nr:very-long-chain enoyl-CoA reductase [Agrilus planipennis]XP_018330967.1 very-long-chain enoyl-CoA reductase [Agrilus planipennis]